MHVHAVGGRRLVQQRARLLVDDPVQTARSAHDPVRLEAARSERLGELVGDERSADRNAGLAAVDLFGNRARVVEILKGK